MVQGGSCHLFVICQMMLELSEFELVLPCLSLLIDFISQCPKLYSKLILSVSKKKSIDEVIPSFLSYL